MKQNFNKGILKIIDLLDYEFYVVVLDKKIKCTCTHQGTSQADPACPRCLGTGHKIKIKRARGACQDSQVPSTTRATTDFIVSRNYYIKTTFDIKNEDIIVDKDEPWIVFQYSEHRSFDGVEQFKKCACIPKKLDSAIFLQNFYKAIGVVK